MNFLIPLDYFHIENVQFLKIKKNIVMENSFFIKMIYTDENIVMNGIYLDIPLLSNYNGQYNSSYFFFNVSNKETESSQVLAKLIEMENNILQYFQFIIPTTNNKDNDKKTPVFSLKTQLEKGFIKWGYSKKPFPKPLQHICLKISGIWESSKEYGINYKFLPY